MEDFAIIEHQAQVRKLN